MGQENEQQAELIATIQHEHVAMKQWYNSHADAKSLHATYGPTYPAFWRDVINWDGWKETRKLYLKSLEGKIESSTASNTTAGNSADGQSAVPRKRKSRWAQASNDDHATGESAGASNDRSKRKSRWARGEETNPSPAPAAVPKNSVLDLLPGLPNKLSSVQSDELATLQKTLRECNAKLSNLESEAARIDALPIGHRERSPSPPPVYGPDGKRKNTRAVRWRERYTSLRQDTLEKILKLTTGGNAAATVAPSLFNRKRTKKIYIPVDQHPTYNFIGLIIGPRGKTQKEMEEKTGCKIAIRGKGSIKEGARGRRDGKIMEGDDEPLHVVVSGDNQECVDNAAKLIEDMLIVIDDDKNIHKQAQLRELALLNGTLKEDEYCSLCAEKGHRAFECPKRFSMNKPSIEVKCAICGDTSHPTRDCKQKDAAMTNEKDASQLDSDYLAFMNELDGKPADAPAIDSGPPLQSLVTSIGPDGKVIGGPPLCQTIVTNNEKKEPEISTDSTSVPLITTISSRMVKASTATADSSSALAETVNNNVEPLATGPTASNFVSAPLPTNIPPPTAAVSSAPPPISMGAPQIPPPPPGTASYVQQNPTYFAPQPPTNIPQQQHPYYNPPLQPVHQYNYAGYPQGGHLYPQGYPSQGFQNVPAAPNVGWNYNNYYSNNGSTQNGSADGGSGFNWWESNEE